MINQSIDTRRPLKVRQAGIATRVARYLSRRNITPNQISLASIAFAALAALCLLMVPLIGTHVWWLTLSAALLIQCRLLCNLFDGMVAIEGGKSTPAGELFNDIPDRIADPLILVCAGYAIAGAFALAVPLAWCAALFAVLTAYVRTLAASIGAPVDFCGPMAKQHRMAIMTVACVMSAVEAFIWQSQYSLFIALTVITLGCAVTVVRRTINAYRFLENKPQEQ